MIAVALNPALLKELTLFAKIAMISKIPQKFADFSELVFADFEWWGGGLRPFTLRKYSSSLRSSALPLRESGR